MKHNHIINLYDVFDEPSYYYLVTELMLGGELFDRIVTKTFYTEKEARDVCKILFDALGYCHSHAIAHRDLKPENLLLMSRNDDKNIKIADFGFAKKVSSSKCLLTQCGTPGYVAPEILHGVPYGVKADMWSLGVITYILLGGYPPFIEQNQRELFKKIKRGQYEFHVEYWGQISKEAKDLIAGLLTVDPDRRMSAEKALQNPWITGSDEMLDGKDLGVNLEQFRRYNAKRKVRQAVLTVSCIVYSFVMFLFIALHFLNSFLLHSSWPQTSLHLWGTCLEVTTTLVEDKSSLDLLLTGTFITYGTVMLKL